ncbi:MAG: hypothetical protein ACPGYV_15150, partial [Phycisphaeraceae bacterium]
LAGMNSVGLFASRAFVSAFALAAALKWGPEIGLIDRTGLLQQIHSVPGWFTHDLTVGLLGLLALLEIAAEKSPDARALMIEVDGYLKSAMAFVSTLVVSGAITPQDQDVLEDILSWQTPLQAGFGNSAVGLIAATTAAAGVWFTCEARRNLLGILGEADPDDDTMVGGLFSWLEDIWAFFGTFTLILFPVFMLIVSAAVLGTVALLQWRAKRREAKSKIACTGCDRTIYRSAARCPNCQTPNPDVCALSWLGRSKQTPAPDPSKQPVLLTQKQRCPVCATHLEPRQTRQTCPACSHALFDDDADRKAYLAELDGRLPKVMIVTALLSLIPIVGLIPAIMVYRLRLIAPLRRYLTVARRMPLGCGLRLLFVVLIWVQVIPVIGAAAVPLMATISYGIYRRAFNGQLQAERRPA